MEANSRGPDRSFRCIRRHFTLRICECRVIRSMADFPLQALVNEKLDVSGLRRVFLHHFCKHALSGVVVRITIIGIDCIKYITRSQKEEVLNADSLQQSHHTLVLAYPMAEAELVAERLDGTTGSKADNATPLRSSLKRVSGS